MGLYRFLFPVRAAYKCAVESSHCHRRSRDGIYSAIPDLLDAKWRRNWGGEVGLARGKGGSVPDAVLPVGRQAPREWRRSSNWPSASIPTAAAAGHPIRRSNRTSPLVTVEAPVLVSAGSYWLQTRLQEPPLRVPPRTIHSSTRAPCGPATRHHLVLGTRVACRA